jgi:hypothetical protein
MYFLLSAPPRPTKASTEVSLWANKMYRMAPWRLFEQLTILLIVMPAYQIHLKLKREHIHQTSRNQKSRPDHGCNCIRVVDHTLSAL